jgi:hypothetical protein
MRAIVTTLFVAFVALSASAGDAVVTSETPHGKFELTVKSTPSTDRPGVFTLDAVLKNLTSGEVIAEPQVVFDSIEGFKVSMKGEKDQFTASLAATESNKATLDVEYQIAGEVVFAPQVVFHLK